MPVDVTAMKKRPSKRASRLRRARSRAPRSRPRISSMRRRYAPDAPSTSRFQTLPAEPAHYDGHQFGEVVMARSRLLGLVVLLVAGVGIAHSATQSSAEGELRKAVQ